jgi:hypothetical protein
LNNLLPQQEQVVLLEQKAQEPQMDADGRR